MRGSKAGWRGGRKEGGRKPAGQGEEVGRGVLQEWGGSTG